MVISTDTLGAGKISPPVAADVASPAHCAPKAAAAPQSLQAASALASATVAKKFGLLDALRNIFRRTPPRPMVEIAVKIEVATPASRLRLSELSPEWIDKTKRAIESSVNCKKLMRDTIAGYPAMICNLLKIPMRTNVLAQGSIVARIVADTNDELRNLRDTFASDYRIVDSTQKRFLTIAFIQHLSNVSDKNWDTLQDRLAYFKPKKEAEEIVANTKESLKEMHQLCSTLLAEPKDLNESEYQRTIQQLREAALRCATANGLIESLDERMKRIR